MGHNELNVNRIIVIVWVPSLLLSSVTVRNFNSSSLKHDAFAQSGNRTASMVLYNVTTMGYILAVPRRADCAGTDDRRVAPSATPVRVLRTCGTGRARVGDSSTLSYAPPNTTLILEVKKAIEQPTVTTARLICLTNGQTCLTP